MHLGILTSTSGWHIQDLARAAIERGFTPELLDFQNLIATVPTAPRSHDAIIVRNMPVGSLEQVIFRMDGLVALQASGTRIINDPKSLEACIDKFLTTHRLAAAGLPTPRTWVGEKADLAMAAFEELGGDVVVKPLFGAEGRGMVRVTERELAWRTFAAIEWAQGVIYQQEFVAHPGWDLRVVVLQGKVLGAMRRYAANDWRTNVAQGARAEAVVPSNDEIELALAATAAVGCHVAGVDLLPSSRGMLLLEVNGVPGWRALAKACDIDVAGAIVESLR